MNRINAIHNCTSEGILSRRVAVLFLAFTAVAGCGGGNKGGQDMGGAPVASELALASGDGQAAPLNAKLAQPLQVRVSAADHRPVPSVKVTWAVGSGGGTLAATSSTTDADGLASVNASVGSVAGDDTFTATVTGLSGSPITFHASAKSATTLTVVSGDGQSGTAGGALAMPLVVAVTDGYGNPVTGVPVQWSVTAGGGSVSSAAVTSDASGKASVMATLGPLDQGDVFQAAVSGLAGSPAQFSAMRNSFQLVYTDPPTGKSLRLVKNAASTPTTVVLDLVAGKALTGWSAGFNLPFDVSKVKLDAAPFTVGSGLNAGNNPAAAKLTVPSSGPLANMLVVGVSQKAAGNGASSGDATVAAGTVLFTITLDLVGTAPTGTVFDGSAPAFVLPSGGMRDKQGNAVAGPADVAIGKLEIHP
jgi:Bacterial Ig-like domain (group 1)